MIIDAIQGHFHVVPRSIRIKEHSDSSFVVSSFIQIAQLGKIAYPSLPLQEGLVSASKHEMTALSRSASGISGLTVEDRDERIIHLLQTPNIECTVVHEAMHACSHADFGTFFGKDMDEGMTELLAREIMQILDTQTGSKMLGTRGKIYTHEVVIAQTLIDTFGRAVILNAYFCGQINPIRDLVMAGFSAKGLRKEWAALKGKLGRTGEDAPFWRLFGPF